MYPSRYSLNSSSQGDDLMDLFDKFVTFELDILNLSEEVLLGLD
jgi:hypothetical protein